MTPLLRKRLLLAAGVAVLFLAVWHDLFLSGLIPIDGNMAGLGYPDWAIFQAAVRHPHQLLWNPLKNMGEPFLADPKTMAAYPVRWLLAGCEHFLGFMRLWVAFHTALAVVFMGLLSYRWYKDPQAALAAGLLYGFGGFFIARVTLPDSLAAVAWAPALLYFLDRQSILGFGGSVALQWLSGVPSYSYLSVLFAALLALRQKRAGVQCFIGGSLLAAGLSAIQWVPFLEMLQLSTRSFILDPGAAIQFSLSGTLLLKELFLPQWIRYISIGANDIGIACFYVGWAGLGLAVWGTARGERREKQMAIVVGACLLLSLGAHLPGYERLFFLHVFRFPALWLMGAAVGIPLLSAAGISRLRPSWKSAALALIAIDLFCFAQPARSAWLPSAYLDEKPALAETLLHNAAYPTRLYYAPPLDTLWRQQSMNSWEDFRLLKDMLLPSIGTAWGIPEVISYQVLRSKRAALLQERIRQEGPASPLWEQAGISTVVRLTPGSPHVDRAHIEIWRTKNPRPPLYLEPPAQGVVEIQQSEAGYLEAKVDSKSGGRVVFREIAYPGWYATLDDVNTPIQLFADAFIAVPVLAGKYYLTLRYMPLSFRVGAVISTITLLGILGVLGFKTCRRTGRRSVPGNRAR